MCSVGISDSVLPGQGAAGCEGGVSAFRGDEAHHSLALSTPGLYWV
jgi:hypothetical protein